MNFLNASMDVLLDLYLDIKDFVIKNPDKTKKDSTAKIHLEKVQYELEQISVSSEKSSQKTPKLHENHLNR
jgi:hypothetical protein